MRTYRIPFSQIPQLSKRDKAYNNGASNLKDFYQYDVSIEAFEEVLDSRSKFPIDRATLKEVLEDQYAGRDIVRALRNNLNALQSDNCFTIITAHQPSLFTGPLYFIYKIVSTIHLCKRLSERYQDHQFVPVFITGGEDHDFEEINHLNLFNNRIEWQNDENGAVGMMHTDSLREVLEELRNILGDSEQAQDIYKLIYDTHTKHAVYGEAVRALVHQLFGHKGLVIANMNDRRFKQLFTPIVKAELLEQTSKNLIDHTASQLTEIGFKQQAIARDINLFYLRDQIRERIVLEDGVYKVLSTDIQFSEIEIIEELNDYPERFSPNVIMRPLFQELIFPNLAYIGGGGELAYWMERMEQFKHFNIHFPMLIRRNSVLWLDSGMYKKMDKLGLTITQLFEDTDALINQYVYENADESLNFDSEKAQLNTIFDSICEKTEKVDSTLVKTMRAEETKQLKSIEQLESRVVRAEKQKHEVAINQIRSLKEKLFPNNGLQERHDNFLNFYLKYGTRFFEILYQELDPLEKGFVVIVDDGSEKG